MTLTGFKAKNHPQQIGTRGALDEVDDRGTEPEFVRGLEERFGKPFTLDVAAAAHNTKCDRYFTRADDGLAQSWAGERIWCNPPYSNLGDCDRPPFGCCLLIWEAPSDYLVALHRIRIQEASA